MPGRSLHRKAHEHENLVGGFGESPDFSRHPLLKDVDSAGPRNGRFAPRRTPIIGCMDGCVDHNSGRAAVEANVGDAW